MEQTPIQFQEIEIDTAELLQEIGTPGVKKRFRLPPNVATEIRRQQVTRLEENIRVLRKKQQEFHQKMEDYIASLQGLIANLQKGLGGQEQDPAACADATQRGTHVRCVGCGNEHVFPEVDVLFANEPADEELFTKPIEVIVQESGKLKKGTFRCPRCGDCNLSIRPQS